MIIVLVGPTGVGKTKMSIELAKKFNAEIINADSTQVYKELNIATAKVTIEEMECVKHHLLSFVNVSDKYSVYNYQIEARKIINDIEKRNKNVIIVGGSGLYLSALLYNYEFREEDNIYDFDSLTDKEMYETLKDIDPDIKIHKNNRQRLIRAYAKYINNSEPIDTENKGNILMYDCHIIGLTADRDILYDKINKRVDAMIESGLIAEARSILSKYRDTKEIRTVIGYKEFIPYISSECGLEEVITNIKQNCRNYAKRQYTWFNHKMKVEWFDVDYTNFNNTINKVEKYIKGQEDAKIL